MKIELSFHYRPSNTAHQRAAGQDIARPPAERVPHARAHEGFGKYLLDYSQNPTQAQSSGIFVGIRGHPPCCTRRVDFDLPLLQRSMTIVLLDIARTLVDGALGLPLACAAEREG